MRPRSEVWQGCSGYWQNQFIRENLLPLGHAAWQGFMTQGRGMVVCNVTMPAAHCANANGGAVDWCSDIVDYTVRFVPLPDVSAYLRSLSLEATLIEHLTDIVQIYDPDQAILLLMNENGRVDINLLRNLKVSPLDCYQQVQRRWIEFQLDQSPGVLYEQRL
jgi:hypothetical protein